MSEPMDEFAMMTKMWIAFHEARPDVGLVWFIQHYRDGEFLIELNDRPACENCGGNRFPISEGVCQLCLDNETGAAALGTMIASLRAELSALRAVQPLTPCPTNHKTSWVPMRGLLSVVPTSWANFWRKSLDGEPLITFCPDCGALLDSLADKGSE